MYAYRLAWPAISSSKLTTIQVCSGLQMSAPARMVGRSMEIRLNSGRLHRTSEAYTGVRTRGCPACRAFWVAVVGRYAHYSLGGNGFKERLRGGRLQHRTEWLTWLRNQLDGEQRAVQRDHYLRWQAVPKAKGSEGDGKGSS